MDVDMGQHPQLTERMGHIACKVVTQRLNQPYYANRGYTIGSCIRCDSQHATRLCSRAQNLYSKYHQATAIPLPQSAYNMSRATIRRNIHFLDGENNKILGFWQNGSVSWSQIAEWMHITITLPSVQYAVFRCLESGNTANPATNHGPSINLSGNNNAVHPGYYVVLSANGEYRDSNPLLNLSFTLMRTLIGEPLDISITEERAIPRSVSYNLTNPDPRVGISLLLQLYPKIVRHLIIDQQVAAFRQRVRERDECCVISGIRVPFQEYDGF